MLTPLARLLLAVQLCSVTVPPDIDTTPPSPRAQELRAPAQLWLRLQLISVTVPPVTYITAPFMKLSPWPLLDRPSCAVVW